MFSTTDLLVGVDIRRRTNVVQVFDQLVNVSLFNWLPNGCELSGRGSLLRRLLPNLRPPSFSAIAAASPVRSSELLAAPRHVLIY